jgi:hypothetical protein
MNQYGLNELIFMQKNVGQLWVVLLKSVIIIPHFRFHGQQMINNDLYISKNQL